MEYSLQTRDIENSVLPVARELGVGIVPYSPLGRGLLSATFKTLEDIPEGDWRKTQPRFKDVEAFSTNSAHQDFFDFAAKKNCTPAQLALAWLLAQGDDIVPIPGTKSASRVVENIDAVAVQLTAEEVKLGNVHNDLSYPHLAYPSLSQRIQSILLYLILTLPNVSHPHLSYPVLFSGCDGASWCGRSLRWYVGHFQHTSVNTYTDTTVLLVLLRCW